MKNHPVKCFFITIITFIILLSFSKNSSLQENIQYKWFKITGNWSVVVDRNDSYLKENKSKAFNYDYNTLVNYNSIITNDTLERFTNLNLSFEIHPQNTESSFIIFFDAQNYRQFYAVQFTGDSKTIHTVSIIKSDIKDTTLPKQAKGNFYITTLASRVVSLEYGKTYTLSITVQGKIVSVAIDNTQVLSHTLTEEPEGGKIGFASKNCIPIIDNLKVYKGKDIIFEDDFSKESIRKIVLQGRKLTPQEIEEQKKKKKQK